MDKKNFGRREFINKVNSAMGFTYPKLHRGKKIFVDFYVYDPASGERQRFKKHFDSIKNRKEQKEAIDHYIATMSDKLRRGWNPLVECGNKGLTTINLIFEKYLNSLSQYQRKKTEQSYGSRLTILKSYLSELPYPPQYAYQLNRGFFMEYLDWLISDRDIAPRTWNAYKGWCSSFCEWMRSRGYINENPAKGIRKMKVGEKNRRALNSDELKRFFEYLKGNDKNFLLACMFEYYTFIRPTELSHLKIQDIDIKNQNIFVSGSFSKNWKDGVVSLNRNLIFLMLELDVFKNPGEFYLFGKNFKPGMERISPDQFNKKMATVRKKLKFKEDVKFYSLKDTGIRDLANEKGIVVARDQARHSDISTTNKYLSGRDYKGPQAAKEFIGDFNID